MAESSEPFHLLFVCTGNTCRSPMAEAVARKLLEERGWDHVRVSSAGVAGHGGHPATGGAVRAAEAADLDLSEHRSQGVTEELVAEADLILAMSPSHLLAFEGTEAEERAALLTEFAAAEDPEGVPGSVLDPFGGPDEVYRATFELLERLVERSLRRLEPILAP